MNISIYFCGEEYCEMMMPADGVSPVLYGKYAFHKDVMFGGSFNVIVDRAEHVSQVKFICAFLPDKDRM